MLAIHDAFSIRTFPQHKHPRGTQKNIHTAQVCINVYNRQMSILHAFEKICFVVVTRLSCGSQIWGWEHVNSSVILASWAAMICRLRPLALPLVPVLLLSLTQVAREGLAQAEGMGLGRSSILNGVDASISILVPF